MSITLEQIRDTFSGGFKGRPPYTGVADLNPDKADFFIPPLKKSAFLVPIIERDGELFVLLTKRSENVARNPGMVVFPGGKADEEDASIADSAVREAEEEIGLKPEDIEVLGEMPSYQAAYGFDMTPVVGILKPRPLEDYSLDPEEVGSVHEVPLSFFLDPNNLEEGTAAFEDDAGRVHILKTHKYNYQGLEITYNTAGMIHGLVNILTPDDPAPAAVRVPVRQRQLGVF